MTEQKKQQQPTDRYFIQNDDARFFEMLYHSDGGVETLRLTPGLNVVSAETLDKCLAKTEPRFGSVAGIEALTFVDPSRINLTEARRVIAGTKNRDALAAWGEIEKREAVLALICP